MNYEILLFHFISTDNLTKHNTKNKKPTDLILPLLNTFS